MISYLFLSVILFCGAFAKTGGDSSIVLPKSLKEIHFNYEGTWKTRHGEIPVNGEFFLCLKGNKLSVLDISNLEWEGKTFNVKELILVDTKMRTKDSYVVINNRCFVSHFSKDKGTFPRFSEWKETGNNKFEISARGRIALKQILDSKLGKALAKRAEKTHDFSMRVILTLKKNKISEAVLKFLMDNKEVATKTIRVTKNIEGKLEPKLFEVPAVCKNLDAEKQKKAFELHMRVFGLNLGDEEGKSKEKGVTKEKSEEELQTQGEVEESDEEMTKDTKPEEEMKEDEQITESDMEKSKDNEEEEDVKEVEEGDLEDRSKQQRHGEKLNKLRELKDKFESDQ